MISSSRVSLRSMKMTESNYNYMTLVYAQAKRSSSVSEQLLDAAQRRYDRVIGVAICTSREQYVYMGVSISLLYPSLHINWGEPERAAHRRCECARIFICIYVYMYGSTVTRIYCTAMRILLQKRNVVWRKLIAHVRAPRSDQRAFAESAKLSASTKEKRAADIAERWEGRSMRSSLRIALSTQLTLYGKEKQRACVELDLY